MRIKAIARETIAYGHARSCHKDDEKIIYFFCLNHVLL
jgi:hypothetical protein